jgi:hypothetical protein
VSLPTSIGVPIAHCVYNIFSQHAPCWQPPPQDTESASKTTAISPINTTSSSASKRSRGQPPHPHHHTCISFPAPDAEYTVHGAKRPVLQRPLISCRCVLIGVLPMFFMSLGAMPFTCQGSKEDVRDASCLIEPDPAQPQGLPRLASTTILLNFKLYLTKNMPHMPLQWIFGWRVPGLIGLGRGPHGA